MQRLIAILFVTLFFISACHSKENAPYLSNEAAATEAAAVVDATAAAEGSVSSKMKLMEPPIPENTSSRVEAATPRQIIKTATIRMQVNDAEKSHAAIQQLVKNNQAYFGKDERSQNNGSIDYNTTIRVAATSFDTLVDLLLKEAVFINNKEINTDDVTSEYVDVAARLRNKKELEQRYLQILKQATKVTDILEVEQNLQTIREDIEATEARLKSMQDQIAYSTIHLSFYQRLPYANEPGYSFGYKMLQSLKNGWYGLGELLLGLLSIWPMLIMIAVGVYFFFRWRKAKKAKNSATNP